MSAHAASFDCEVAMRWIALLACLVFAETASAQSAPVDANKWSHGTTLEGFAGAAVTPSAMATYGGSFGWELTPRFEVQGLGSWFPQSTGPDEFAADLKVLMNLMPPAILVPYVTGGAGLYQGTFDRADSQIDPTAVVGAGAHFYVRRHLSIRPEATLRFVIDQSKTYKVATITFALTYHFEEHAVGNAR
jgi:hypothetical protein